MWPGLPDNAAGFAQAIVRLRDRYAPNVVLGYHFSTWGTGTDIVYADPSDATVNSLGVRTARFEQSLGGPVRHRVHGSVGPRCSVQAVRGRRWRRVVVHRG